jgi:hypothetical protein
MPLVRSMVKPADFRHGHNPAKSGSSTPLPWQSLPSER